jgi:hypothetical protein
MYNLQVASKSKFQVLKVPSYYCFYNRFSVFIIGFRFSAASNRLQIYYFSRHLFAVFTWRMLYVTFWHRIDFSKAILICDQEQVQ